MRDADRDLERLSLTQPFRFVSRPIAVTFKAANADTDVLHGLAEIPDGFIVLNSIGVITRSPLVTWTKDLVSLRSSVANNEAIVIFVVLKEAPLNVNP